MISIHCDIIKVNGRNFELQRLMRFIWLPLLALAMIGCSDQPERIWLNAPGWNRAALVAKTPLVDAVTMALDDSGDIYLFLFSANEHAYTPRLIALDRRADVIWDRTYEMALKRPDQSRILWDGEALQLFWISDQQLFNAQVEAATGDLLGSTTLLSGSMEVASYDIAQDDSGAMAIWYAGSQESPGLYALPPGAPEGEATLVDTLGIFPNLKYDGAGTLHATWSHYPPDENHPQFFYADYQDGLYVPDRETMMLEPRVGTSRVYGPWLGLDEKDVYLLWTIIPRIGPSAGAATTHFMHFPQGQPDAASSVGQLFIPYTYHLDYQSLPESGLKTGPGVILGPETDAGNSFISELAIDPARAPEMAIAFHTKLAYLRRKEQGQVSTVFLQNGEPFAYQQISFTPASSDYPAILSDQAGQLYITWLEGAAKTGYDVYFASTAPDIRKVLGRITWDDVGRLGAETAFGFLGGAVLAPLALAWVVAPLVVLGLTSVIRRKDESFISPGVIISLTLAIAAYWVSKLALLPTICDYVPFSAWLPFIPSVLSLPLQVGVPVLISGLALVVAWRYTYGHERPSPFFFLLIFVAVDGILTMAVYGVTFYGAF